MITQPLTQATGNNQVEILTEQEKHAKRTRAVNQRIKKKQAEDIREKVTTPLKRAMLPSEEKGASTWLTTIPIEEHGFALHIAAFRDALALRSCCRSKGMPVTCACRKSNTVDHALSCPKGGHVIMCHNEVSDLTASLLDEAAKCVEKKPVLQPLTGEELSLMTANTDDNGRPDIKCRGFWIDGQDALFDGYLTHQQLSIILRPLPPCSENKKNGGYTTKEYRKLSTALE